MVKTCKSSIWANQVGTGISKRYIKENSILTGFQPEPEKQACWRLIILLNILQKTDTKPNIKLRGQHIWWKFLFWKYKRQAGVANQLFQYNIKQNNTTLW